MEHAACLIRMAAEDLSVVAGSHSASLGLLPAGFTGRILPEKELSGPELTVKRTRRELPQRLLQLRLSVLRNTATVYKRWEQRRSGMLGRPPAEDRTNRARNTRHRCRSDRALARQTKRTRALPSSPAPQDAGECTPPGAKRPKPRGQVSPSTDYHQPFSRERVCAVGVFSGLKSHTPSPDDNSTRNESGKVIDHTNTDITHT